MLQLIYLVQVLLFGQIVRRHLYFGIYELPLKLGGVEGPVRS